MRRRQDHSGLWRAAYWTWIAFAVSLAARSVGASLLLLGSTWAIRRHPDAVRKARKVLVPVLVVCGAVLLVVGWLLVPIVLLGVALIWPANYYRAWKRF